ncbi:MAG: hypothetical protein CMH54_14890 [Myxococcales bacterium]|nr:hypothetical protein [Myxococcales bacterium]
MKPIYRFGYLALCALVALSALQGCGEDDWGPAVDPDYGKPILEAPPSAGKADNMDGIAGPTAATEGAATEVWAVTNQWEDRYTDAAVQEGIAWGFDSGLDWDEKYALWVQSLERIPGERYGETFELTTPWGARLKAPALECAEASVFLRVTFASWYGLPFYISAWAPEGNIHFGHFGVWTDKEPHYKFSNYRDRYPDYSYLSLAEAQANWPTDARLARRSLGANKDDLNEWLGPEAYAGAYFDQIFLNKRVGHFLMVVLTFTGSVHLASTDNTFNLTAPAVRAGDTLLERWQKKGIGHTLVVKHVSPIAGTSQLEAELVSGSMPRRQPKWESAASSQQSFLSYSAGGPGENADGEAYVTLGGGIKRWRIAKIINGRWRNVVPESDRENFIPRHNTDALAARLEIFKEILGTLTPEEKIEVLQQQIQSKRQHLRQFPASCSARISRESAFDELYELAEDEFGWSTHEVDQMYRVIEDYIFAELEYQSSRTCCWNSTTVDMYHIIMDLNEGYTYDSETGTCREPLVFKMVDGGYKVFSDHASTMGLSHAWVEWSADEPCPQEFSVTTDTEVVHTRASYCEAFSSDSP